SIAGSTVTMTSGTGICTLTASIGATADYNAAPDVVQTVDAQKGAQSALTVNVPTSAVYGQTYTLTTSGGDGTGAVSFSVTGDACTLSGTTLTITSGTGTCTVTATKA